VTTVARPQVLARAEDAEELTGSAQVYRWVNLPHMAARMAQSDHTRKPYASSPGKGASKPQTGARMYTAHILPAEATASERILTHNTSSPRRETGMRYYELIGAIVRHCPPSFGSIKRCYTTLKMRCTGPALNLGRCVTQASNLCCSIPE
jgi:hypothetical protein